MMMEDMSLISWHRLLEDEVHPKLLENFNIVSPHDTRKAVFIGGQRPWLSRILIPELLIVAIEEFQEDSADGSHPIVRKV